MIRRRLSLPHAEHVPVLRALLAGAAVGRVSDGAVTAAMFHRIADDLTAAVERGTATVDAGSLQTLRKRRIRTALHGRLLRAELERVIPELTAACGVEPLLIKGPAVADRFYPAGRRRPFGDLDLLVPRDRLAAAVAALEERGYVRGDEPWPGFGERHGHEVALLGDVGSHRVICELHWRISDDRAAGRLDYAYLRQAAERLPGGAALVPAPVDQLLVLAVHLLHEPEKRLGWIRDLEHVAGTLDDHAWRMAFERADRLGLSWVLHRALDYGARHLQLDRPRPSVPGPPPPWGPFRAAEVLEGWVGRQAGRVPGPGWWRRDAFLRSALRARWDTIAPWS